MNKYEVFFEIYGKKMRAIVEADSEYYAEESIRDKIEICKIVLKEGEEPKPQKAPSDFDFMDMLNKFGMNK